MERGERAILRRVTGDDDDSYLATELRTAWEAVESDWENDDAHKRFLALCAASERLAVAGRRYRRVLDTDPARAAGAERRMQTLLTLATEQLLRHKTPPAEKGTPRLTLVAIGVAAVIIGMTLWQLTRLR